VIIFYWELYALRSACAVLVKENKVVRLLYLLTAPILCNIYLHKLDLEVYRIQKKLRIRSSKFFRKDPEKVTFYLKTKGFSTLYNKKRFEVTKEQQGDACNIGLSHTSSYDLNLTYVRYVDDFLFGIAGPKSLVITIKKRVIQFVKSDLKLELVGGEVTHVSSGKISFLGLDISGASHFGFSPRFCNALEKKKRVVRRLAIQRKVKEDRTLKLFQLCAKKLVDKSFSNDVKGLFHFKLKFHVIIKNILSNNKFMCSNTAIYKEFIRCVYAGQTFVPDSLAHTCRMFENELIYWKGSYEKTNAIPFAGKSKKMTSKKAIFTLLISAPLKELKEKLKIKGRMLNQPNHIIVGWFRSVAQGFLEYYRCCSNFVKVKNYVDYFIR
jgi:hypothetical protein